MHCFCNEEKGLQESACIAGDITLERAVYAMFCDFSVIQQACLINQNTGKQSQTRMIHYYPLLSIMIHCDRLKYAMCVCVCWLCMCVFSETISFKFQRRPFWPRRVRGRFPSQDIGERQQMAEEWGISFLSLDGTAAHLYKHHGRAGLMLPSAGSFGREVR